jgi:hypothetical protein
MKKIILRSVMTVVATALLFLTILVIVNNTRFVSSAVLKSFMTVHDIVVEKNEKLELEVIEAYNLFEKAFVEDRENVGTYFEKALEARRLSEEFRQSIRFAKAEMIAMSSGISVEEVFDFNLHKIKRPDDFDTPTRYFIVDGKGVEIREKIAEFVLVMTALLPEDTQSSIVSPFDITGPFYDAKGVRISWEIANFYKAIIVSAITILNVLENDAMNLELDVVNALLKITTMPNA